MPTAIVIGAGLSGIGVAARLAARGFRVTVLERLSAPGGRCGRLVSGGYSFDTGPTLYLMPPVFEETFAALGEKVTDHLKLLRVDPTYRVHFTSGGALDITSDMVRMREQMQSIEPGSFARLLQFLAAGDVFLETSLERFVGRNFLTLLDYFSPANLPLMFRLKALQKHFPFVASHFRDPRFRAAFFFQNMYLGLSPYSAMVIYALLLFSEIAEGVWFPEGGIYRVVEALAAIARSLGVRFEFDTPVSRILVSGSSAQGVVTQAGDTFHADLVVATADLPYVYANLLPDDGSAARLAAKQYTSSAIMFYWGLKGERTPALLHHNVFLSEHRYRESFDRIFREHSLPDEPSFYVAAPSRSDDATAPPGCDALTVLVPVGHLDSRAGQDWPAMQARAREAVLSGLARVGAPGIDQRIDFEATMTPESYERELNLVRGSAFGLSHNFLQVGYLRPHNRHGRFRNLYFAGASTHPGTGLPLVLLSARLVTERILRDLGLAP